LEKERPKFALFKKSTFVVGQKKKWWLLFLLVVFCTQLWDGGFGRGHFQQSIYLYKTGGGSGISTT